MGKKNLEGARPELGDVARDTVTKYEGVVIGDTLWLHGCRRLTLQPPVDKDGKIPDNMSFDEHQLEVVKKGAVPVTPVAERRQPEIRTTGGPWPDAKPQRG